MRAALTCNRSSPKVSHGERPSHRPTHQLAQRLAQRGHGLARQWLTRQVSARRVDATRWVGILRNHPWRERMAGGGSNHPWRERMAGGGKKPPSCSMEACAETDAGALRQPARGPWCIG